MEKASEILHEAVQVSLQHALFAFDPSRSATAWVRGIAARLLLNRRRAEARGRRCVSATVLGEATWVAAWGSSAPDPAKGRSPDVSTWRRRSGAFPRRSGTPSNAATTGGLTATIWRAPWASPRPGPHACGCAGAAGSEGPVSPRRGRGPSMNDAPKPSAPGPRGVALPGRRRCGRSGSRGRSMGTSRPRPGTPTDAGRARRRCLRGGKSQREPAPRTERATAPPLGRLGRCLGRRGGSLFDRCSRPARARRQGYDSEPWKEPACPAGHIPTV